MSDQNLFVYPVNTLQYHQRRIYQIKNSAVYAGCMADHYKAQFEKRCHGRNFCRAAFAWFKWKHFESEYYRISVKEMLEAKNIKLTP